MNKTAFSDTASDRKSRLNSQEEELFDLFIEDDSPLGEGPYTGHIIETEVSTKNTLIAYIRIPEIHDFILPFPCKEKYTEQQNKALKTMLLTAVRRKDINSDEGTSGEVDYRGRKVEITFLNGDPTQNGKMRGATFKFISSEVENDAQFCYLTSNEQQLSVKDINGISKSVISSKSNFIKKTSRGTGGVWSPGSNYDSSHNPGLIITNWAPEIANSKPSTKGSWWYETLIDCIALGAPRKAPNEFCSWGKQYRDYCAPMDGGNVGIAHFANRLLKNLFDEIVKEYGEETVKKWFKVDPNNKNGATFDNFKPKNMKNPPTSLDTIRKMLPYNFLRDSSKRKNFSKLTGTAIRYKNGSYKQDGWFNEGWKSYVSSDANKLLKTQHSAYVTKVKIVQITIKKYGWPINERNLAILLGIANSATSLMKICSKNGKLSPEQTLSEYTARGGSHRMKRAVAIDKRWPIQEPKPANQWPAKSLKYLPTAEQIRAAIGD